MNQSIFESKNVIIQGITGKNGSFHTEKMLKYGTNIVAGTSPNKSGNKIHSVPVYQSIKDIQEDFGVGISVIFVPANHAKGAIFEAIDAKIPLIICITEHIPIHDMLAVKSRLKHSESTLIGPNSPGVLIPGKQLLGIIPAKLGLPGKTAIVSRSGTLTYEAMNSLSERGIGQKYIVGIGGDSIRGSNYQTILELFQNDPEVEQILMIGEIGGQDEVNVAKYIKNEINKPIYAYIAGHTAPIGVQMGHAGAILKSDQESAKYKTKILKESGAITADNLQQLIDLM